MFSEGLNTKHFEVRISNGLALEWSILDIAIVYGPDQSKIEMLEIRIKWLPFFPIFNGFGQNGCYFF